MSSKIFEEKPAAAPAQQMGGEKAKIEKQARQLAYDTRYQVKKEVGEKNVNPAVIKQLLMKQLAKSTAAPTIKARAKQMLLGEDYIGDTRDMASNSLANAMFRVFVEGVQKNPAPIQLDYLQELAENPDKKYKVRVTDKNTGNSYIRYATREKITQLRSNPNIQSVEMTEYGEPREGERTRGETTAKAKSGRGLDPVGKEDSKGDVDNDGIPASRDKNDQYLLKRRKAIGNAIQQRQNVSASYEPESKLVESKHKKTKKPRWQDSDGDGKWYEPGQDVKVKKEEYIADAADSSEKKITGKGVDNYAGGKNAVVKVFPQNTENNLDRAGQTGSMSVMSDYEVNGPILVEKAVSTAQQKFMGMVYAAKKGEKPASPEVAKAAKEMTKKEAKKFAKTKHKGLPVHKEECGCDDEPKLKKSGDSISDVRELPTKINLAKNKLRAMGLKMSYEPEGETVSEGGAGALLKLAGAGLGMWAAGKGMEAAKRKVDSSIDKARKTSPIGGDRYSSKMKQLNQSYEPNGEQVMVDGYDSTYGRGERGEPKGTQRQNVDPEAWERSRKQWEKLQPDIFKPRTPQAKATKTSKTKTA